MLPLLESELRAMLKAQLATNALGADQFLVEELGIERGGARIDVAMIGDQLIGFEIKSDIDTLDRLSFQIHAYNRVFDQITLVVGDRFAQMAEEILPPWWGIIKAIRQLDGAANLVSVRSASRNMRQDAYSMATLLWKDEVIAILTDHAKNVAEFSSRWNKDRLYVALAEALPLEELRINVTAKLRSRKDWRNRAQ